ncbi:F-box only protein 25-like [Paramacrobiotus metropolitanus]|uniref:F-box only protein 25-like n=1 Tax=Paramacrobiotus metropolitanus TaxID=2943436 RepID=UPI002445A64B|nr:F-box only protein 25-like [Paramacrobiotus metropolitanus]XP_055330622.1 F-box only protein 25-like [Paramacrobiotus metropolitanus]XP_055330624.1 F-box only protein 25-like [Paramacrobiotus metropolitanus]XP_055330625.1 F-box only protein 25-like [Paramacrobiotus metropolitanus]
MPFIGLDWRSPGEHWMKTPTGSWERTKILESVGRSRENSVSEDSDDSSKENNVHSGRRCAAEDRDAPPEVVGKESGDHGNAVTVYQPHCHIAKRTSRENTAYVSLSEAFWKLDFCGAVRDLRRFNYVCKVLDVLISEKLASLGGQAQKLLFSTLDHVVTQVVCTQQNVHIIRQLMRDLNEAMEESKMSWGKHVGSELLWKGHKMRLQQWNHVMDDLIVHQSTECNQAVLTDLPEECMRLILLCLSDHHDLIRCAAALPASPSKFGHLFDEQRLWKELCFFHFDAGQLAQVAKTCQNNAGSDCTEKDWEDMYHRLKRFFGLKETYAETLQLCLHCRTLFWQSYGHPCPVLADDRSSAAWRAHFTHKQPIPISPRAFLEFFSL